MPRGDREIYKADCEDGYTRIANLILEALSLVKLNATQMGICLFLLRRTYGWNRSEDAISLGDFASACGTSKAYISRQIADLLEKNIMRRVSYEPGKTPVYAFVSTLTFWNNECIDLKLLSENAEMGVYDCIDQGLSDQTIAGGYGLSNRIRVGLSDCATLNRAQSLDEPVIEPVLKTIVKTKKEKVIFTTCSPEYQLAQLLLDKILEHLPGYKMPDLQKWAKSMDLLLRLDKRPPEEVEEVIIFAQEDLFWRANILSVDKLRKHYDRLNSRRLQARASPGTATRAYRQQYRGEDDEYNDFFK